MHLPNCTSIVEISAYSGLNVITLYRRIKNLLLTYVCLLRMVPVSCSRISVKLLPERLRVRWNCNDSVQAISEVVIFN